MDISIVIPCKDDTRIIRCIDSIRENIEIVIVFNGSSDEYIKNITEHYVDSKKKLKYIKIKQANLALALEKGTWSSKNDCVLYMDSDCTYDKGAIKAFYYKVSAGDPKSEVYKGDVIFENSGSIISKIIAKSRQHHTAEKLTAYKPPLLVSKKIARKIGGYFFNEKLIWREDADLDNRIRKANIKIIHVPKGKIYHEALTLKTDLRSTFRYGIGGAIAKSLNIKLTEVPRSFRSTLASQGILPALYMLFRNRFYTAGYYYQQIKSSFCE